MSHILLEPAFVLGFACCFALIALSLLLFLLVAPFVEDRASFRRSPKPRRFNLRMLLPGRLARAKIVATQRHSGVLDRLRAAAIRAVRRWAPSIGGFAGVSAFWLLFAYTVVAGHA